MSPTDLIAVIRALDALLALASNAGANVAKVIAMREANASGHLTDDQVGQLVVEAHEAVDRLGPRT